MSSVVAKPTAGAPARVHPAFEWLSSKRIESLNLVVEAYRHRKTGAQYYHLAAAEAENVFLVALRTVPGDSTGVAHILEHTVLCGSERYPVRDPFFMMIRRSLNTFMNAFTSSDWTAYPFASQNRKDFNNLLDVYLDAVFFSRLHELDFAQEGHRVEFADDETLQFKGVVFNEMKGAMSSPTSTLWQTLTKYLFPTTTYHFNSGGDPEHIPDLSYRQLKAFYRSHYHPSNAVFMTFGDIPAVEHQQRMHELALSRFDRLDVNIAVPDEKRYHAPLCVQESYALDESGDLSNRSHIVIGWLLGHSSDLMEELEAHLLEGILLDDSASPLRQALETTELGTAPSPLCGVESSNHEMCFVCGLEGSRAEHADAVEALVLGVLRKVSEEGIATERVEAVLHQLELSQREISGDGYPYGLQLILEGLSSAVHGGEPEAALDLDPVLEALRRKIRDPAYIPGLVRELLLDNQHRVRLTLVPDAGLSARREQAEKQRLAAISRHMDESRRLQVVEQARALAERQQLEDDPDLLPKVGLEDIPPEMRIATGEATTVAGRPASLYPQGTNGLVYQQVIADLPALEPALMDTLPLFTNVLTQLGCAGQDYLAIQALQSSISGGLSASSSMRGGVADVQQLKGYFVLSGKALVRNHGALADLVRDTFNAPRFDEHGRIRELIAQQRARREQSVTGSGHGLAMLAASSGLSNGAALAHRLRGLAGIRALKQLDDSLAEPAALHGLSERFADLHAQLLQAPRQFLLIAEAERMEQARAELENSWAGQEAAGRVPVFSAEPVQRQVKTAWLTNTQVNFCARAFPAVPLEHEDAAALSVLAGFLRNGYLHRTIREQGGAYGGGASFDSDNAAFRFFSYRDPRLEETLNDFNQAVVWLLEEKHPWLRVEEAILGVIGNIDKPGSPAGEARDAFFSNLHGRTPERRQRFRQRVLDVSLEDLRRVGESYLRPERASTAVIAANSARQRCEVLGLEVNTL